MPLTSKNSDHTLTGVWNHHLKSNPNYAFGRMPQPIHAVVDDQRQFFEDASQMLTSTFDSKDSCCQIFLALFTRTSVPA